MRKKLRFYRQHTDFTCGPACILMLLDYYEKILYPTEGLEKSIYDAYKSERYGSVDGAAIARHLAKNRLMTTIYHSSEKGMDNKNGYFNEEIYENLLSTYYMHLEKSKGEVSTVHTETINCDFLRSLLEQKYQIVLECFVDGNVDGVHEKVLHWILIYGYENGEFLVANPSSTKKSRYCDEEMEEYMNTPIGKMVVAVKEPGGSNT